MTHATTSPRGTRRRHLRSILMLGLLASSGCAPKCGGPRAAGGGSPTLQPAASLLKAQVEKATDGALKVQCSAKGRPISDTIFGIAFADAPKDLGATAHRWGGNTTSRYNWKLGDAWSTAQDWYWQNVHIDSYEVFLGKARGSGGYAAITVPTLGWVAKDTSSYTFPVKTFGPQQSTDPDNHDRGNGMSLTGKPLEPGSPEKTSVRSTPEFVGEWVREIVKKEKAAGGPRQVRMYILDNEPGLWSSTHRDVHPDPSTYDELLEKTIAYATVIRKEDPDAKIAGPASYGWWEYFYSAKDQAAGFPLKPDRRAHGDRPFLEWYLDKLREYEAKNKVRLLDVLDVHFYPQGDNIQAAAGGEPTDPSTSAARIRSTRALWDPTYKDESWIGENVYLIPRMKKIIEDHYPGLALSIGEYNFGGEHHMSGSIALAEALGRMVDGGVDYAFYWMAPKADSPASWAFRAYRNYDGNGGHFLEQYVPSSAPDGDRSLFVSKSAAGDKLVIVALNKDAKDAYSLKLNLSECGETTSMRSFVYDSGGLAGFHDGSAQLRKAPAGIEQKLSPYSVNVIEVSLKPAAK